VLQEILHRYVAIHRRDAIQPAFDALLRVVDEVFPIELPDVERAKTVVLGHPALSARDAVHIAIMERQGISRIMSFDSGFDTYPGLERLGR
jgi:predicted nucleic acid-binding protein